MDYKQLDNDDLSIFQKIIGSQYIFSDTQQLLDYSHDETEDLSFPPEVVLKPLTTKEISAILKYCNEKRIAVGMLRLIDLVKAGL